MDPNNIRPKTTAADFLLNIGAIITLYTVVTTLLTLLFTAIEKAYPPITDSYYYSPSISWPVSILIIVFPVFLIIMWSLEKMYAEDPEKRNLWIRKWLTYITLSIGGVVLIADLVTVVYYFIDGQDLTPGFLLKVLSVLVITIIVFMYYVSDLRNTLTSSQRAIYLYVSTLVVLFSIIWGFSVLGSPRTQRLIRYDEQKVSDLQNINSQVESYFYNKNVLPQTLAEMSDSNYYMATITDQQTNKPYEYRKTGNLSYELCAEFNKSTNEIMGGRSRPYGSWAHPALRYCFGKTVTPSQNSLLAPPAKPY